MLQHTSHEIKGHLQLIHHAHSDLLLQVSEACFQPASMAAVAETPQRIGGDLRRVALQHTGSAAVHGSPAEWSRDRAYMQTGVWKGQADGHWHAPEHGGSDVCRPLNKYAMDKHSGSQPILCTKHQGTVGKLIPGCFFHWCTVCSVCVCYHVMADAESPKTVFDALYTRWQTPPLQFCLDNGCNLHTYCLNREPQHFKQTQFYIDQSHFRGHSRCSPAYNTGMLGAFRPDMGCKILIAQAEALFDVIIMRT